MRTLPPLAILILATACLRAPPEPAPRDAGSPADAAVEPPLALSSVTVADATGAPWPLEATPRRPVVRLSWTSAPRLDDEPPVWLLHGSPDDDLREDLGRAPLRVATRARIVRARLVAGARSWELRPEERLAPGTELTLAVASWLRAAHDGVAIGEPALLALRVSDAPEAGAEATASWPPDGAMTVSPSLGELAVRFDGPLGGLVEGAIALHEGGRPEEASVAEVTCAEVGWPDGWCVRIAPARLLRRGAAHRVVVGAEQLDATGAPVGPFAATFTTALDEPAGAPAPRPPAACALDEEVSELGCLLSDDDRVVLRLETGEPMRWRMTLDGRLALGIAPRGATVIAFRGLGPGRALEAELALEGTGGAVARLTLPVETSPPLAAVSIVEVRPDPHGPEPTQEYVELLNYGAVPLSLDGFHLADRDDRVGDTLSGVVAPGERVLVVPERFDPDHPADPPVPPGVRLVRVDASLGSGGISNAGEPLYLRDAAGRRVSAAPPLAARPGVCLVRVGEDMRGAEGFVLAPCTPGVP
ncbi:MAG: lamin tail domain-containing protein [Sandaracinaceae bacterium]|nr:lamin tail domain-containing protein [Sandaracinaceae bacterium]